MSIDSQMKLKTAGWRIALGTNPPSSYEWSRDGIDWYTEDEALVVVLTAERDAAIARAERAEADVAAWRRVTGRDDHDTLDFELGRTGIDTHLRVLTALLRDRPEIAMADAREACAHGLTVSADHGVDVDVLLRIERALRAHAAKVSR